MQGTEWKFSFHVLIAALLLLIAIFTVHFCIFSSLRLQATFQYEAGALVAGFLLALLCSVLSVWAYFVWFTSQLRLLSVVGIESAIVLFYFVGTAGMTFRFDVYAPSAFSDSWSAASVQLAGGMVTLMAVGVWHVM